MAKTLVMENNSLVARAISRIYEALNRAVSRIQPFVLLVSCLGIWLGYLTGMYATGSFHSASRWMGAMLSCTSLITVLQMPTYKESIGPSLMRVFGTFLGALIAYIYLKMLPFSVMGMLLAVAVLEMLCMMMNIYNKGRIATITLVIIMLVSQMSPESDPAVNCSLRFFESAVGVGVGLLLRWSIEKWNALRLRLLHMGRSEDGQMVDMDTMPLRWGHIKVLMVASLGQLTGGALATLVGVVLPLMESLTNTHLPAFEQGLLASMSLIGIMVGSIFIGEWSDKRGYLRYLRISPALILLGAVMAMLTTSVGMLMLSLFIMGFGVGGGYSLDSDYISEIMPRRWRLFMVGVAKATSAIGNVVMAFACYYILKNWSSTDLWNGMFLLVALLAIVMLLCSVRFAQSPGWLLSRGRREEAERTVRYFLGADVAIGEMATPPDVSPSKRSMLRADNLLRVIFSGVPWACEGFAVYGVGVFLPILIMALGLGKSGDGVAHIASSVELSAYINIFVAVGFAIGLALVNRLWHTRQQAWGFVVATAGLALLVAAYELHLSKWLMILGFVIFELALNAGPHLITFILPAQIFPVADRGTGAGLAAAFGKAGAVLGVLFIPILMKWGGVMLALAVTAALQIVGAVITMSLGRKILPNKK